MDNLGAIAPQTPRLALPARAASPGAPAPGPSNQCPQRAGGASQGGPAPGRPLVPEAPVGEARR
eukprot:5203006-Alexandrium_andersonii.AAC.1